MKDQDLTDIVYEFGSLIAASIGPATLRQHCVHFNA
jgi:hypothetical protein